MFIALTASACIIILLLWWYLEFYRYDRFLKKYPVPRLIPLLGNALDFPNSTETLKTFSNFQQQYGENYRILIGNHTYLVVTGSDLMQFFLGSSVILKKSRDYHGFALWLGDGLLTTNGKTWKNHRKILTPTFHFKILEQFIEGFDAASNILVKKLKQEIGNSSFDIFPYISLCALDIICETTMGTSINAQENSDSEYIRSVKEMCRIIMNRTFSPLKSFDFFYQFSGDFQKEKKAVKVLHDFSNAVIKQRQNYLKNIEYDSIEEKKHLPFLDALLRATIDGKPLSDSAIRAEVDTFMFEGHDTTTSAISFTLFCLASHQHIQEKVINELETIFHNDITAPTSYSSLQEMKYLELVIKESLRLYPSVPIIGRILDEDIEHDGTTFPKGLLIALLIYGAGRNPKVFPNPEKFDPERFRLDNSTQRAPYSYVPFSAGPRNCIGQKFAMLEMKAVISKILRKYKLSPATPEHKPVLAAETILKSANGVCLSLNERSN